MPLHSPHALPQGHPFFLQVHSSVPHCFADELLQLQRMLDRRVSGAAGISVMIGCRTFEILLHPQSHGCNPQSMFGVSDLLISRYTLREWKWAALSKGGRVAGSTSLASRIAFSHFACLNVVRLSLSFPPNIIFISCMPANPISSCFAFTALNFWARCWTSFNFRLFRIFNFPWLCMPYV